MIGRKYRVILNKGNRLGDDLGNGLRIVLTTHSYN